MVQHVSWCWHTYLQNWVILFRHILGKYSSTMEHMGVAMLLISHICDYPSGRLTI